MRRLALVLLVALAAAGCAQDAPPAASPQPLPTPSTRDPSDPSASDPPSGPPLRLEPFLAGFTQPLFLTHDGVAGEVYVVEQGGLVWRVVDGGEGEVWLDLTSATDPSGEQGLLGLAFEPEGRRAYVTYTDLEGDDQLERVHADGERERILTIDDPYANHNGGMIAFGPDGFLYYGTGDGGSGGDPEGNGQDRTALLGSLLRLDVSGDRGYASPPDNLRNEIWAKGLRNPWRFSFDRETGDLYVADVGQNKWEEVSFVPAGTPAGTNFGWNVFEGTHRFSLVGETFSPHTPPVAEYSTDEGCAVTGGYVYRGTQSPGLVGVYLFGDYCGGQIWGMRQKEGEWQVVELLESGLRISSFGEDAAGEIYVVDHGGAIYRIVGGEMPEALRP